VSCIAANGAAGQVLSLSAKWPGPEAALAGGDRMFLPAEIADFLDRLTALGVSDRAVQIERDMWILLHSASPQQASTWIKEKGRALDDPHLQQVYLDVDRAYDWDPDDPRLEELAEHMWRLAERLPARHESKLASDEAALARLLSTTMEGSSPGWNRLQQLVWAKRGRAEA
jgi:hypothetical protein